MYLLVLGIALVVLKVAEIDPFVNWPWYGVLLPFPLVIAWWTVADMTGFTKKRATEREEERRVARMRKHIDLSKKKA